MVKLLILPAALCWLACCPFLHAAESARFRYPERRYGGGELKYVGDLPVLIARGSPAEIGAQIGNLALQPGRAAQELIQSYLKAQIPPQLLQAVEPVMDSHYQAFPRALREELETMAKAANVPLKQLKWANTLIDLQELVGCSSVMIESGRSATGQMLYARNLDLPHVPRLAEYSLLIVYCPDEGPAFAMPNLPGFLMLASGINAHGVCLGSHSIGTPPDGAPRFDPNGVASAVVGRTLIQNCRNVDEVGSWLRTHTLSRAVSIAACDPRATLVVEATTRGVEFRTAYDGVGVATNHFRCEAFGAPEQCPRFRSLEELSRTERVDITRLQQALHDVHQGPMTVHSMVLEPEKLLLHLSLTPGPSSAGPWTTIALQDLLPE